ncbi:MAG TPA: hypothetical protein VGS13_05790 [Stellaceae bacterium]|nr:hypothetical protein [Stellaceae bacterium]
MRWLHLCGLALGIVAWTRPATANAAEPGDGPGCLGVIVEECVRNLRATMTLDEGFLATAMARRHQTDVNGKPLGPGLVTVYARLPGRMNQFVILLHLGPDDRVHRVESDLLLNLIEAHTEEDYDQSALYDIVSRLVGRRCAGIRKIDLYQFFENSVKPRITQQQEDLGGLHRLVWHAAGAPYCGGVTLGYTNLLQWRGGKNPAAAGKRTQFSSIELQ